MTRGAGSRWQKRLDVTAAGLSVIAALVMTYLGISAIQVLGARQPSGSSTPERGALTFDNAASHGDTDAAVVLIEYSDFECPVCAKFHREVWPELSKSFVDTGKLQFIYKHLPLEGIHPAALGAAEAAECAREQQRFWQAHNWFLSQRRNILNRNSLPSAVAGLDAKAFSECVAEGRRDVVKRHMEEAAELGFRGTPAFVVGTRVGQTSMIPTALIRGLPRGRELFESIELALTKASETSGSSAPGGKD